MKPVGWVTVSTFRKSESYSSRHLSIDIPKQPAVGILIVQSVGVSNRPVKHEILVAVTIQSMNRLTGVPALRLLGLILRVSEAVNRLDSPIDLSAPCSAAHWLILLAWNVIAVFRW
jgi:hypothetical protein